MWRIGFVTMVCGVAIAVMVNFWGPIHQSPVLRLIDRAPDLAIDIRVRPQAAVTAATPLDLTVTGRTQSHSDGHGFRHLWPAVYATAAFQGPEVLIAFDDLINRYDIFVDTFDQPVATVSRPGTLVIEISGLSDGSHVLRLEKISESFADNGAVAGVFVPEPSKARPAPQPNRRQIIFIGDSDTVGQGNLAPKRDCQSDEVFIWTNTRLSFAPMIARHFDADYEMIARSGMGLIRNHSDMAPGAELVSEYAALPAPPDDWSPSLVVLTIGFNDFAAPLPENRRWPDMRALHADFVAVYLRFVRQLALDFPKADILLMTIEGLNDDLDAAQAEILKSLPTDLKDRVLHVPMPPIGQSGCLWHPSLDEHQLIADALIAALEDRPILWERP